MSGTLTTLTALLASRRPDVAAGLAADATLAPGARFDPVRFEATFAALGRRLGTEPLGATATVRDDDGRSWSIACWGLDELGRVILLVGGVPRVPDADQLTWIDACYRTGALRERQAVLRALPLLPAPARFLPIALDAGRTSTQPIFEAIACENPYPAAHCPDPSFHQMVMKAVFTEVPLTRIVGLMTRRGPELTRMATDYAHERRAAGRSVPADLALLINR